MKEYFATEGRGKIPYETANHLTRDEVRKWGAFYTPQMLAEKMAGMFNLVEEMDRGTTILDPCVGKGNLLAACLNLYPWLETKDLYGMDVDPEAIKFCMKKFPGCNFQVGSFLTDPFEDDEFWEKPPLVLWEDYPQNGYAKAENFIVKEKPDSVIITGYVGEAMDIKIPPKIRGKRVVSIEKKAFEGIGLVSVVIPYSVKNIGECAFANNQLTDITMGGVTHVGDSAFENNRLTSVPFDSNITHIGSNAFAGNRFSFSEITVPGNVKYIRRNSFGSPMWIKLVGTTTLGKPGSEKPMKPTIVLTKEQRLELKKGKAERMQILGLLKQAEEMALQLPTQKGTDIILCYLGNHDRHVGRQLKKVQNRLGCYLGCYDFPNKEDGIADAKSFSKGGTVILIDVPEMKVSMHE